MDDVVWRGSLLERFLGTASTGSKGVGNRSDELPCGQGFICMSVGVKNIGDPAWSMTADFGNPPLNLSHRDDV